MTQPKYEYYLKVWGGFFNPWNKEKHGFNDGDYWFDAHEEREVFKSKLEQSARSLRSIDAVIAKYETEGYTTRINPTMHRITRHAGKDYYSSYEMPPCYELSTCEYHMTYKWYPGFNDYPLGEDFDYEKRQDEYAVVAEWITGAFLKEEQYASF
jgi:hypothetical protein